MSAINPVKLERERRLLESGAPIIAVFGESGSGKSTFINLIALEKQEVGYGLDSCTSEINVVEAKVDGKRVVVIDTPGVDDTHPGMGEADILTAISGRLEAMARDRIYVTGVLYLHRITDNKFRQTSSRIYSMVKSLCGDESICRLVICTTMWDKVSEDEGYERLEQFCQGSFWEKMTSMGASIDKISSVNPNSKGEAERILSKLIKDARPVELAIQDEIVNQGKMLGDDDDASNVTSATDGGEAALGHFQQNTAEQTPAPDDRRFTPRVPISVIGNNSNSNIAGNNYTIANNYVKDARDQFADNVAVIEKGLGSNYVPAAVHKAQPANAGCMEGTRINELDEAKGLIIARGGPNVVWISGMAGTGKTSIAVTLCRRLRDDATVVLGGTFFCSRVANDPACTAAENIIPTLVLLLVRVLPRFAQPLAAELKDDPDLAHKSIHVQIERLLAKPLEVLGTFDRPIVFVIDALDECTDKKQLVELLEAIAKFRSTVPVKFLITARPDRWIRKVLAADHSIHSRIELSAIDLRQVTADIRLFLEHRFKAALNPTWYTGADLDQLADSASGLFLFAVFASQYILDGETESGSRNGGSSSRRLHYAMQGDVPRLLFLPLNRLYYAPAIADALDPTASNPHGLDTTYKILSVIMACREPMTVRTLAELLSLSPESLRGALDGFGALIFVPDQDEQGHVRFLHGTIYDLTYSGDTPWPPQVNRNAGHATLAQACFERLDKDLRFNIMCTQSSYEGSLRLRSTKHDIPGGLHYACIHWTHHYFDALKSYPALPHAGASETVWLTPEPAVPIARIDSFLKLKLLFWLEVLSFFGNVDLALPLLRHVANKSESPDVSRFFNDAVSFVEFFREAIEFSPAHIYVSALPFTPENSLVAQTFSKHLANSSSVPTFSIKPHAGCKINAAAVSPDGCFVAFVSSEATLCVWDAKTRREIGATTLHHEGDVCVVAISADGLIATGSVDKTVRFWDVADPHLVLPSLNGHSATIRAIAFSADSTRLVSGSEDKSVRVWVVETGEQLKEIRTSSSISSVAYSPGEAIIAAGDVSGNILRYDATSYKAEKRIKCGSDVRSFAFTPDGSFILAARDNNITSLDLKKRKTIAVVTAHSARVNAVVYSPDGRFIASGADDATVRLWDAKTGKPLGPELNGHSGAVLAVAVSPDGRFVVSADSDGMGRVWCIDPSRDERGEISVLVAARYEDGWLLTPSPSNHRLLWVPPEYRDRIEGRGQSQIIAGHSLYDALYAGGREWHHGEDWFQCWREDS